MSDSDATPAAMAGIPAADIPAADIPVLAITGGQPTAQETAAVAVVLTAALAGQPPEPAAPARSQWAARSRMLRGPVMAGPGGWRASALPR